ncbi:MAG: acetyltransferase [Chloroflexi bacterium]|nr:acetyltransferase [Chloroflexota bacterium]
MSKHVLIIGAGGHAQVVADILWRIYEDDASLRPIGYLDDNDALWEKRFLQLPVFGSLSLLSTISHDAIVVAVGDNQTRRRLFARLSEQGERFVVARHPRTVIAPDVQIGRGAMICAGVVVNPGSVIGENVILNTGCTIDHHNRIRAHVHIAPGAHLGGEVEVEEGAFVGIGATVTPRRRVGGWSVVGAGSVVLHDIPPNVTAVGVPARLLKKG